MTDLSRPQHRISRNKLNEARERWFLLRVQQQQRSPPWFSRYFSWALGHSIGTLFLFFVCCALFGFDECTKSGLGMMAFDEIHNFNLIQNRSNTIVTFATVTALRDPDQIWYHFFKPLFSPTHLSPPLSSIQEEEEDPSSSHDFQEGESESQKTDFLSFFSQPFPFFLETDSEEQQEEAIEGGSVQSYSCRRPFNLNERWGIACRIPRSLYETVAREGQIEIVYLKSDPSINAPVLHGLPIETTSETRLYFFLILFFIIDVQMVLSFCIAVLYFSFFFYKRYQEKDEHILQVIRVFDD